MIAKFRNDGIASFSAVLARLLPLEPARLAVRGTGLALCLMAWPFTASAEYTLRPGDTIAVSTVGPFNIVHESVVDADGLVTMPVIGQVPVAGLTLAEAQAQIAGAMSAEPLRLVGGDGLERWLNLQPSEVVVEIAIYAPVFVTGTVAQPGRFIYTPGMTVRQLIAEAGGLGVGMLPEDPNSRLSIELAADREVAAQRVDSIMTQVDRLREELRTVSGEAGETVALAEPAAAEDPAFAPETAPEVEPQAEAEPQPEVEPQPELELQPEVGSEALVVAEGAGDVTRPRARPTEGTQQADVAEAAPPTAPTGDQTLSIAEAPLAEEEPPAAEPEVPEVAPREVPEVAPPEVPEVAPVPTSGAGDQLQDVGRQLVEASVTMRGVDAEASRRLIEEMNERLELLSQRQIDEQELVARDRSEVARVQDLIERGLVPATEAEVAERALLMSSMQSYDTADQIARLEIELSRITADLERQPSEAARAVLLELENQLAEAEVARAQLESIDQRLALLGGPAATQTALDFEFVLHRGSGESAVATKVDQDEPLLPGDVLEVIILLADAPQSSASLE